MTLQLKDAWEAVNKALAIMNIILFCILTLNYVELKKLPYQKVPVIANVLLLVFLSLGVYAAFVNVM